MEIVLAALSAISRRGMIVVVLFIVGLSLTSLNGFGQSSDDQQVKDVIAQLFRGMELGDSAMVRKCFLPQPTMATVRADKEGKTILTRDGNLSGFLKAVGTPHAGKWYEETWNVRVSIDGQLAQVWCDYAFYLGNKYSHCGVDAFHLYKEAGQWRIFHLADTRRPSDCNVPAEPETCAIVIIVMPGELRSMKTARYKRFLAACLMGVLCSAVTALHAQQITTFILVRHAEKLVNSGEDPALSAEGNARAKRLQLLLEKTAIDAIYTTPYKRTRSTVEPLAQAKGMTIREYEPEKPAAIDEMLTTYAGKTILVSGHSNTIPEIANWLTGSNQFAAFDDTDYGNLLVISVLTKGDARVTWLRY